MTDSRFWLRTADRLARRLNFGLWLERSLPLLAGISVVGACVVLALRNRSTPIDERFWVSFVAVLVVAGIVAYIVQARVRRIRREDALVWLEHRLGLNNRLTAAANDVGEWPDPELASRALELLAFKPTRVLPAPLFSIALLLAATWIPVTPELEPVPPPSAAPHAWTEIERWLDDVEETELVDEQAIDAWHERLDSLEEQPPEEWYSHSSLEASDSLREELASELRALERGLSEAEATLSEMLEQGENASPEKRRLSRDRMANALDDLDLATLPLSRKIERQLMTLAREREIKPMTKEQLEALRERLRERRYASLPQPGDEAYAFLTPDSGESSGGQPGKGGVNRGPGSAPIELADEATELATTRVEDVAGREPLGTDMGETVSVGIGEHDIDTSGFRGGQSAGAVSATGDGGALVWSQTLTPEESRVLKKYFK